ncbi:MAG: hypothetical protein ACI81R_002704 [Bradymonadia bacterium]|jgi:hypothetical protein
MGAAQSTSDGWLAIDPNLPLRACESTESEVINFGQSAAGAMQYSGAISPGDVEGTQRFGSYCVGYYADGASHFCFEVASETTLVLELTESDTDTTLAIRGAEDFVQCDDDGGNGLLSRIETTLSPGQYLVHVGTFSRQVTGRFTLQAARVQ